MADWARKIGAMTLMVSDLGRSKEFYQQVFGLPVEFEDAGTVMFRFADVYVFLHAAPGAGGPQSAAVIEAAQTGAGQLAIIVADVDAVSAELTARGMSPLSGPCDRAWGMRTVTFADPSGHVWEIAQELPRP